MPGYDCDALRAEDRYLYRLGAPFLSSRAQRSEVEGSTVAFTGN